MVDPVEVFQKPEPRHLDDVGGVALWQLEVAGHGPDQPRVLVDQVLPRGSVPHRRAPHKLRDIDAAVVMPRRNYVRTAPRCRSPAHVIVTTAASSHQPSHPIPPYAISYCLTARTAQPLHNGAVSALPR